MVHSLQQRCDHSSYLLAVLLKLGGSHHKSSVRTEPDVSRRGQLVKSRLRQLRCGRQRQHGSVYVGILQRRHAGGVRSHLDISDFIGINAALLQHLPGNVIGRAAVAADAPFFSGKLFDFLIAGWAMMYMGGHFVVNITALVATPLAAASMPGSGAAL